MIFNINVYSTCTLMEPYLIQCCAKKWPLCKKKWPPVQKKRPLCIKNEPRNKKLSVKKFLFFVDKLNMIDFNIFKMLKLIFTCESCAISITE